MNSHIPESLAATVLCKIGHDKLLSFLGQKNLREKESIYNPDMGDAAQNCRRRRSDSLILMPFIHDS